VDLIKRLAVIVLLFVAFMTLRFTFDHQPRAETGTNLDDESSQLSSQRELNYDKSRVNSVGIGS